MNMFRMTIRRGREELLCTFGPSEIRALRRGAIWGTVAFLPIFAFWTIMGSPWAGCLEGLVFACLAFFPGLLTGLQNTKEK
jgi:hypothetical protein